MTITASAIGFIVILTIYASVGVFAVIGSAVVTRKLFPPRLEQIFYAGFLMAIAAFYLAFAAYFGAHEAWSMESSAVALFCLIALVGLRLPSALILGYVLHGAWDFLHELQAHGAAAVFDPGQATAIPLAYGVFCAAFDFGIAIYFYQRRAEWNAAWQNRAPAPSTA